MKLCQYRGAPSVPSEFLSSGNTCNKAQLPRIIYTLHLEGRRWRWGRRVMGWGWVGMGWDGMGWGSGFSDTSTRLNTQVVSRSPGGLRDALQTLGKWEGFNRAHTKSSSLHFPCHGQPQPAPIAALPQLARSCLCPTQRRSSTRSRDGAGSPGWSRSQGASGQVLLLPSGDGLCVHGAIVCVRECTYCGSRLGKGSDTLAGATSAGVEQSLVY